MVTLYFDTAANCGIADFTWFSDPNFVVDGFFLRKTLLVAAQANQPSTHPPTLLRREHFSLSPDSLQFQFVTDIKAEVG